MEVHAKCYVRVVSSRCLKMHSFACVVDDRYRLSREGDRRAQP